MVIVVQKRVEPSSPWKGAAAAHRPPVRPIPRAHWRASPVEPGVAITVILPQREDDALLRRPSCLGCWASPATEPRRGRGTSHDEVGAFGAQAGLLPDARGRSPMRRLRRPGGERTGRACTAARTVPPACPRRVGRTAGDGWLPPGRFHPVAVRRAKEARARVGCRGPTRAVSSLSR